MSDNNKEIADTFSVGEDLEFAPLSRDEIKIQAKHAVYLDDEPVQNAELFDLALCGLFRIHQYEQQIHSSQKSKLDGSQIGELALEQKLLDHPFPYLWRRIRDEDKKKIKQSLFSICEILVTTLDTFGSQSSVLNKMGNLSLLHFMMFDQNNRSESLRREILESWITNSILFKRDDKSESEESTLEKP